MRFDKLLVATSLVSSEKGAGSAGVQDQISSDQSPKCLPLFHVVHKVSTLDAAQMGTGTTKNG